MCLNILGCVWAGVSGWDRHLNCGLRKAAAPPLCEWASCHLLRAWLEQQAEEGGLALPCGLTSWTGTSQLQEQGFPSLAWFSGLQTGPNAPGALPAHHGASLSPRPWEPIPHKKSHFIFYRFRSLENPTSQSLILQPQSSLGWHLAWNLRDSQSEPPSQTVPRFQSTEMVWDDTHS